MWLESSTAEWQAYLNRVAAEVVAVDAETVDPARDGQLVYVSGWAEAGGPVSDPAFEVDVPALLLRRDVEMFQTRSRTKGSGKNKRTTYFETWAKGSTRDTGCRNPKPGYACRTWTAEPIELGAYVLDPRFARQLDNWVEVPPDKVKTASNSMECLEYRGGWHYIDRRRSGPRVGDLRLRFSVRRPQVVSVCARQNGKRLEPVEDSAGTRHCWIVRGTEDAATMLTAVRDTSVRKAWFWRGALALAFCFGGALVVLPLVVTRERARAWADRVQSTVSSFAPQRS